MGNTEDPTSYSYSISKFRDLLQTPTISTLLNSFKYQLFIKNVKEENPSQPYLSFAPFLTLLKEGASDEGT
jgi:hypothetical protein